MVSPCVAFTRLLERLYPEISVLVGVVYHTGIGSVVDGDSDEMVNLFCSARVRA